MLRKLYLSRLVHRRWLMELKFFRNYIQTPIATIVRRKHEFNPEINVALRPWLIPPKDVRVVFVFSGGPYMDRRMNHGWPVSSPSFDPNKRFPDSWSHLIKEQCTSLGYTRPKHASLASWQAKGVMMMNLVLTNNAKHPHSHEEIGWEYLVYDTIRHLSDNRERIAFVFFGSSCWFLSRRVDEKKHLVLRVAYPSSRKGFKNCNVFTTVLNYIREDRDFFRLPTQTQCKPRKRIVK